MQHLVVPTFVLNADRRVIIWNKACERLTGVPAHEVIGTRHHWRAFYDEERYCLADLVAIGSAESLSDLYVAHSDPGETSHGLRAETWCVMPQVKKRLYLAIDAGPIYDEEGSLLAVVETLRDQTEQKLAQMALQSLAVRDGLTGLANRRSFDEKLEAEWLHNRREGTPLALLLVDVDHFKLYNDTYGHQKGDACLKSVAATLGDQVCRPSDLAARYGGEEFAVIMPNTDLEGAVRVAERIREAVQSPGYRPQRQPKRPPRHGQHRRRRLHPRRGDVLGRSGGRRRRSPVPGQARRPQPGRGHRPAAGAGRGLA